MGLSRMVVLGLREEQVPMHGHQLRRQADAMHVGCRGSVSPGLSIVSFTSSKPKG
jgi:hypothetical protein